MLPGLVETGNKNRCVTEAKFVLRRVMQFRAFPVRVGPRILSLERAHYYFGTRENFSGRKKRKNLNQQNFNGYAFTVCKGVL